MIDSNGNTLDWLADDSNAFSADVIFFVILTEFVVFDMHRKSHFSSQIKSALRVQYKRLLKDE